MKEHMTRIVTWTAVIVLSMTLGAAAVVGVDSLRSESKTATVIERAVPSTSTGVATTTAEDIADLYARVRPSVVRIVGQSTRGSSALGSGVVLDKQGHILTNYHVVQGFDQLDVTFADGAAVLRFQGDSDAHIVRGLIAILFAIYSGKTADDVLGTDAQAIFAELGLKEHLTPQRSNGFAAMVERIRSDAWAVAAPRPEPVRLAVSRSLELQ